MNFSKFINEKNLISRLTKFLLVLIGILVVSLIILKNPYSQYIFENPIISIIIFVVLGLFLISYKIKDKLSIKMSIFIFCYFIFLAIFIYFQGLNLLSNTKPAIFYEFASKGYFKSEGIFNTKNIEESKLENTVDKIFKKTGNNLINVKSKHTFYSILNNNYNTTFDEIKNNIEFQNYLLTINWKTEDVMNYISKIASIDEFILTAGSYISFFLLLIYCLFKRIFRVEMYLIAGFLYIVSILGSITNDFTYYIVFQSEDIPNVVKTINAVKEAFLTYIIFDTLHQIIVSKKKIITAESINEINVESTIREKAQNYIYIKPKKPYQKSKKRK